MAGFARQCLLLVAVTGIAGCGFHPLYAVRGNSSPTLHELSLIDVDRMPDRAGQLLRQALQQRLSDPDTGPAKQYELSVSFGIASDQIGVQQDSTVTRVRQTGTATWFLKKLDPGNTVVTSGTARALDGLNVIDQQYFEADLAGEASQRRIADAVAGQIALQLASFFSRHPAAAPG